VAERDLEIEVMKEIAAKMVGVPARREQVAYAIRRGLSQRRLCTLLDVSRVEGLTIKVDGRLRAGRVIEVLLRLVS
jgi:hypothetical protein